MLGLLYETPLEWADQVMTEPAALLLDHLFCERKAAAMALFTQRVHARRFPILNQLMPPLAQEEFEHAEQVERILKDFPARPTVAPTGGKRVRAGTAQAHGRARARYVSRYAAGLRRD